MDPLGSLDAEDALWDRINKLRDNLTQQELGIQPNLGSFVDNYQTIVDSITDNYKEPDTEIGKTIFNKLSILYLSFNERNTALMQLTDPNTKKELYYETIREKLKCEPSSIIKVYNLDWNTIVDIFVEKSSFDSMILKLSDDLSIQADNSTLEEQNSLITKYLSLLVFIVNKYQSNKKITSLITNIFTQTQEIRKEYSLITRTPIELPMNTLEEAHSSVNKVMNNLFLNINTIIKLTDYYLLCKKLIKTIKKVILDNEDQD